LLDRPSNISLLFQNSGEIAVGQRGIGIETDYRPQLGFRLGEPALAG
jgi:hypothetical protein